MSLVATLPERKQSVAIEQALLGIPVSHELIEAFLFLRALYRTEGAIDASSHRRLVARLAAQELAGR